MKWKKGPRKDSFDNASPYVAKFEDAGVFSEPDNAGDLQRSREMRKTALLPRTSRNH